MAALMTPSPASPARRRVVVKATPARDARARPAAQTIEVVREVIVMSFCLSWVMVGWLRGWARRLPVALGSCAAQPVVNSRMASMNGTTRNSTPGTRVATVTGIQTC